MIGVGDMMERMSSLEGILSNIQYHITGNPNGVLSGLFDAIQEKIDTLKEKIVGVISDKLSGITSAISSIGDALASLVDKFTSFVDGLIDSILSKIGEYLDDIIATFEGVLSKILSNVESLIDGFTDTLSGIVSNISDTLGNTIDQVKEYLGNVIDKLKETFSNFAERVVNTVKDIISKISETAEKVAQKLESAYKAATEKIKAILQDILERIHKILLKFVEKALAIGNWLEDIAIPTLTTLAKDTKEGVIERGHAIRDMLRGITDGNVEQTRQALQTLTEFKRDGDISNMLIAMGMLLSFVPSALGVIAQPSLELMLQNVHANMPTQILPMERLAQAAMRGLISQNEYESLSLRLGYNRDFARLAIETQRPLPSPGAIQEAFLRGFIDEHTHDNMLKRLGYREEDINLFKALYYVIPSVGDIINMAVKEAFTPEVAERFGQYEGFPEVFAKWAAKQGLSEEWAKRYWAAHWRLPSETMGFEMLHRGIISTEELKLLLRALDVMPFWREKLIQLSYEPYTRVDVRRMYQLGILDREGVKRAYLDLGYNDTKAENLTEFTVRYYTPEDKTELDEYRNLTRTVYISAYKRGVISYQDAYQYLTSIGYSQEDTAFLLQLADTELLLQSETSDRIPLLNQTVKYALEAYKRKLYNENELRIILSDLGKTETEIEWYIALSDYEVQSELKLLALETCHENYVQRTWNEAEARDYLGKLDITEQEIVALFERWNIEREARTRKPTEAQARAMYYAGLITIDDYKEHLRGLGYAEKYVHLLAELAKVRK